MSMRERADNTTLMNERKQKCEIETGLVAVDQPSKIDARKLDSLIF